MFVSLGGERCREEWWVTPYRILPADEQVVAGIHCQCRDVLNEEFQLDVLFAKLVQCLQSVAVFLCDHPPRPHLKGRDPGLQLGDVRQEVRIFVLLVCVSVGEVFVSIKARSELPDVEGACLPVDDDDVRPVEGETDRGRNRPSVRCLVALDVRVELEPGPVDTLRT